VDELVKTVTEKAGINPEQAQKAVNTVMEFIKNKIPGVGDKLKELLAGGGGEGGSEGVIDKIRKKVGI